MLGLMTPRDLVDLIVLAMLWGGSFIFMRAAVPDFGPLPLIALRVGIATLTLLPLLARHGLLRGLRAHAGPLLVVGLTNSALPFTLFAWATLTLTGGFAAVLNAVAPMWSAVIGWLWLRDRLRPAQWTGLAVGFAGVLVLAWDRIGTAGDARATATAIGVALLATVSYGWSANYTKRRFAGVPSMLVAGGSQLGAALAMTPLALLALPPAMPSPAAWACVIVLGVASTGLAYLLFFRLIARTGAARAISVTFLVPVFGVVWGGLFLGESVSARMVAGGAIVLLGTALATGTVDLGRRRRAGRDG